MFGGNVGDEERRAYREPANVAAGEEVVFGGALFARKIEADAEYEDEIDGDDGDIDRRERPVRDCDSRCEEHRASVNRRDDEIELRTTTLSERRARAASPDCERQKPGCKSRARRSLYQRVGRLNGAREKP